MSKQTVKNYTINTTNRTITLTDFATIHLGRLRVIFDTTRNIILYNLVDPTVSGASASGNTITLGTLPGSVSVTDELTIIYDTAAGDPLYDATPVVNAEIEEYQDVDRRSLVCTQLDRPDYFQAAGAIATNTVIMPLTDIGDCTWVSITVHAGGAWTGAMTVQQSNDQSQVNNSQMYVDGSLSTGPISTITQDGTYFVRKTEKYMKVYYSAWTTGTAATLSLRYMTTPWADFGTDFVGANTATTATNTATLAGAVSGGKVLTTDTNSAAIKSDLDSIATNTTGAATATNQATANTSLSTIATDVAPLVAPGAGGYVRQDSTATIAKETGGNLAAAKTDLDTIVTNTTNIATAANQTTGNTSLASIATHQTDKTQETRLTDGTNDASIQAYGAGQNAITTGGAYKEWSGLSAGALNADLVASLDVSNLTRFSLQVIGTFVGTLTFQGSNDGTNFGNVPVFNVASAAAVGVASQTTTGTYYGYANFRYLRVRMTAWTSGTATGVLEGYANAGGQPTIGVQATQSGTWNATQLTSPWVTSDRGATGTATRPATSTTSATVLASNASRKQAIVVNDSTANLYILYGSGTASATNYTYKLAAAASQQIDKYTGAITGVLDASTGSAQVTEVA